MSDLQLFILQASVTSYGIILFVSLLTGFAEYDKTYHTAKVWHIVFFTYHIGRFLARIMTTNISDVVKLFKRKR